MSSSHFLTSGADNRLFLVAASAFLAGVFVVLGVHHILTPWYSPQLSGIASDSDPVRAEHDDGAAVYTTAVLNEEIVDGIEGTIGNTPLILLRSLSEASGRRILAKAEFLNGAGGSSKDRLALAVIQAAERSCLLSPGRGDTIYEGTVGSTGISLAVLARARGHRAHIVMPDDQSSEKVALLTALGAHVERVPVAPFASAEHFVNLARRRAADHSRPDPASTIPSVSSSCGYFVNQFENPENAAVHELTTGPEIWRQTAGRVDAFVAGAGTGGTLAGVARFLKLPPRSRGGDSNHQIQGVAPAPGALIVLADPQGSGLFHRIRHGVMWSETEREGARRRRQVDSIVEGIGINRVVANLELARDLIDDAVQVTDDQACRMARWLVDRDGVFVGSSSAVNCVGAVITAMLLPAGSTVVTVLCDSGTRHLSKFWARVADMADRDPARAGWAASPEAGDFNLFTAVGIPNRPQR